MCIRCAIHRWRICERWRRDRKVTAIIRIVAAFHRNLVAGINLRHASQGRQHRKRQLETFRRRTLLRDEAVRIVIAEEEHQPLRVWIKPVLPHHLEQLRHRLVVQQHIANRVIYRKIERRIQPRINSLLLHSARKERRDCRIPIEHFPHRRQVGIHRMNRFVKLLPERSAHVRERVDAQSIQARSLNPPQRILDQVLRYQWILLVHVRHRVHEPSMSNVVIRTRRSMRIHHRLEVILHWIMVLHRPV